MNTTGNSAARPAHGVDPDAINGPETGQEQADHFRDEPPRVSSTEAGLSNYEQNYPDGVAPNSGPRPEIPGRPFEPKDEAAR